MHTLGAIVKFDIFKTAEFDAWLGSQQLRTQTLIESRLDLISIGHFGDHKRFSELIEFRWKNGIRIYSFIWKKTVVVALNGGNKNGQSRDIKKAQKIKDKIVDGL